MEPGFKLRQFLSLERAWHEAGSERLSVDSQLSPAPSSMGRGQGCGGAVSKR